MLNILVIGRHPEIMSRIVERLRADRHNAIPALSDEDALFEATKPGLDLVIIGGGVDDRLRGQIRAILESSDSAAQLIEHFGDPQGLFRQVSELANKQDR
jgi:hypothetical protein